MNRGMAAVVAGFSIGGVALGATVASLATSHPADVVSVQTASTPLPSPTGAAPVATAQPVRPVIAEPLVPTPAPTPVPMQASGYVVISTTLVTPGGSDPHGAGVIFHIPAGTIFSTAAGVEFSATASETVTIKPGSPSQEIHVIAVSDGTSGNVPAGSISEWRTNNPCASSEMCRPSDVAVTNPAATAGGA